ncbi:MAG: hypothetical protein CL450_08805 [Acidimicrobiaceae bacterium]|nr:hypothetical protein [Acidimicrobiaceae bacterium]
MPHDAAVPVAKVHFGAQKRAVCPRAATLAQRGGQPVAQPRLGKGAHERHGPDGAVPKAVDRAHRDRSLSSHETGDPRCDLARQVVHGLGAVVVVVFFFERGDYKFFFLNA